MTASSFISPKAVKGESSGIQVRGLFATAPIAAGEIVAIKGGHIVDGATLRALPERLRNSEIQIADGFHLVATHESEYEPVGPGEELTTDNALFDDSDGQMTCRCRAESCRGVISGRDWRRPELQEQYRDYFSAYLLDRIRGRQ